MSESAVTRFVILAAPRTGSNMLCTLLNSHDDVLCHHEIFNPGGIYYALPLRDGEFSLGTIEERNRDPLMFLERVWQTPLNHRCVGFKMTHRQNELVFDAVLRDKDVRKIVLRRKNRIKTFVSWCIAEQLGQWEVYSQADLVHERPRVNVGLAELSSSISANENYYADIEASLRSSHQSYLQVTYENLFSAQEQQRVLEFLGVVPAQATAPVSLQVRSVKQNSNDLRNLIANFGELETALRNTPLEGELYSLDA